MDIESIREYCLSLPLATEDMAFGDVCLLFRVCDKIFGCLGLDMSDCLAVKSDPEVAIDLRERYAEIEPAYHWNKKYWIQISLNGGLSDAMIKSLIRSSYAQVVKKLPKRLQVAYPEITVIGPDTDF